GGVALATFVTSSPGDAMPQAHPLEPDRGAMERMGRQAIEFIADRHDHAPADQRLGESAALRAALLTPPPSDPSDFSTVLNTFAAHLSGATATLSPTAFDHMPSGGLYTAAVAALLAQGINPFTGVAAQA